MTTSWRISVGSRRTVIRAAISRSACSASARRARAARDLSSSSNSRVVRIVMAAWSGDRLEQARRPSRPRRRAGWLKTVSAPIATTLDGEGRGHHGLAARSR